MNACFLKSFLCIGLTLSVSTVFSAEKTVSQKDLAALQEKSQQLTNEINADRKKQARLQEELREKEEEINKLSHMLKVLDKKIAEEETELTLQEAKAKKIDIDVKERQAHLAQSLRALHAAGELPDLKLILNQENPNEWQRVITYYDYFNKALQKEIKELDKSLIEQEQLRDEIAAKKALLSSERENYKNEQEKLRAERQERTALLTKLEKNLTSKDKQLEELKASEQELQRVIAAIQQPHFAQGFPPVNAGDFAKYQGKLPWPTVGKIQHAFGSYRKGGQRRYNGIVLSAPEGQSVQAIFSGRVVYSGWLRGYGLLMIIDHGHNYMTLYAHNDSLFKKVGEMAHAGEQIATVGITGGMRSPGLYFEIRKNGKPVNPQKWLAPQSTTKVNR